MCDGLPPFETAKQLEVDTTRQLCVRTRKRTGVEEFLWLFFLAIINCNYSPREKHDGEQKSRAPPHRSRETRLHAISITLRDFPLRAALFIHSNVNNERA